MDIQVETLMEELNQVNHDLLIAVEKQAIRLGCQLRFAQVDARGDGFCLNLGYDNEIVAAMAGLDYLERSLCQSGLTPEEFDAAVVSGIRYGIDERVGK